MTEKTTRSTPELDSLSEQIIGAAYAVSNALGIGFLERVYENAMAVELAQRGLVVTQQSKYKVRYKDKVVGSYNADLIVDNKIVVEIKVVSAFEQSHMAQCLNYLKASGLELGLLINFGNSRVKIQRVINNS